MLQLQKNGSFNALIAGGRRQEDDDFAKAEALPMPVNCNIHPFMHGFVLVKDDPVHGRFGRGRHV